MNSPVIMRPEPATNVLVPVQQPGYGEETHWEISPLRIWAAIHRNRGLIAAVIGFAVIAAVILTVLTTRVYQATASVQIEGQTTRVLGNNADEEPQLAGSEMDRFLQTQVDIIKSRSLAERVAESLGLFGNKAFLSRTVGRNVDPMTPSQQRAAVVANLISNLTVELPRNSRIVMISFKSASAEIAQQVANSYAQNLIVSNLQRRFDSSSYTRSFLEKQLGIAKSRLEDSERATLAYARDARLLDTSGGQSGATGQTTGPQSLTTSDLVQLNSALVAAKAARVAAEQHWNIARQTPLLSIPEVQTNGAITQLSQQRALAQAAYDQDLQRRKADFPSMKQAAANITALDEQINAIATNILAGIKDQYQTALRQEQSLSDQVSQLRGDTLAEQDRSVRYNILKREADTNRSMYDALLQRYREVSAEAGVTVNNISLLDDADLPGRPVSPRPLLNLAVALVLGSAVAGALTFLRERFDDAIRSPDDVPAKLGSVFLNSVPMLSKSQPVLEALEDPRSSFSEAYYALRTSLRLSAGGTPRSLLLTSSRAGEGKSTTAYTLARSFAQIDLKVLLVDGDLRKPSLHRMLGIRSDHGLSNVLARQIPVDAAIQPTVQPNLSFLPAGPLPPSPTELLSSTSLGEMFKTAYELFDIVIIDGPPVLGLADAVLFSTVVEGTVYVVEAGRGNFGYSRAALKRLLDSGARVLGTVLTKFNARRAGYGYDYGDYAYHYSYGGDQKALESRN